MIEALLKEFRLLAPAEALKERILAAARWARREQLLWRWTLAAAAAVLLAAIPINAAINDRAPAPALNIDREVDEIMTSMNDGEFRARIRMALTPPAAPRPKVEGLP